jgi:hypothetical protein
MNIEKAYEVLGLKLDASIDDLKLAYRDLVNVWHPDRFLHNPRLKEKAEQQLQEINQAYESLLSFMILAGKEGLNEKNGAAGKHSPRSTENRTCPKAFDIIIFYSRLVPSVSGKMYRFDCIRFNAWIRRSVSIVSPYGCRPSDLCLCSDAGMGIC